MQCIVVILSRHYMLIEVRLSEPQTSCVCFVYVSDSNVCLGRQSWEEIPSERAILMSFLAC